MARREFRHPLRFSRAGNFAHPDRYTSPVNGVWGKRSYGHEVPVGRVPSGSLVTFWPSRKSLAAAAAKYLCANDTGKVARRVVAPYAWKKPLLHRPLIRPLRGHLPLSPLSLCDISP